MGVYTLIDTVYSCLGFLVGIVTNALFSSNIRKSAKSIVISLCYIAWIITYIIFNESTNNDLKDKNMSYIISTYWLCIVITVSCLFITLYLIYGSKTINRRKISKILVHETTKASTSQELRLIAGDLDFLGDLTKSPLQTIRIRLLQILNYVPFLNNLTYPQLNEYNDYNEQWQQLNEKQFSQIQILCRKPKITKDFLMLGLIKKTFPTTIIKFYGTPSLLCVDCTNKANCQICSTCDSCAKHKTCNKKRGSCNELLITKNKLCKFQDLDIRGRLFKNRENALRVDIFTKTQNRHKYINNLFTANDYEANFYDKLWHTWWDSCREEAEFLTKCIGDYETYTAKKGAK
jgi:uncharacterized membrane protein